MKRVFIIVFCLLSIMASVTAQKYEVAVKKIWDNGSHCAFTSLIKYKGKYYCSFREGETHIFDRNGNAEGKVRILVSEDGETWKPLALMHKPEYDLRDPKLSVMPDGRLMVTIGGSIYKDKKLTARVPQVSFSTDGISFTEPVPIRIEEKAQNGNDWLWRVTWDGLVGYGVNYYSQEGDRELRVALLKTTDGINYQWVTDLDVSGGPTEATVRILPDKKMLMMVRRDGGNGHGYWGVSEPPYTAWEWKEMKMALGGPDFISLGKGVIVAGSRSMYIPSHPKTVLFTGNEEGDFQETYVLPSGGDTSYPGFLVEGDQLWVSYYSSHETANAAVYLAKLPLSLFLQNKN